MEPIVLRELTDLHGEQFIRHCYSRLLHREADESGKAMFLSQLQNGESKAVIIGRLLRSPEGRRVGERVTGLWPRFYYHRLLSVPIVGRVLSILTLPVIATTLSRDVKALQALHAELATRLVSSSFDTYLPGILSTMSSLHALVRETQNRTNVIEQTVGSHERTLQVREVGDAAIHRKLSNDIESLSARSTLTEDSLQSLRVTVDSLKEVQPTVTNLLQSYPAAARETTRQLAGLGSAVQNLTGRADSLVQELNQLRELSGRSTSQVMSSFEERIRPVAERLADAHREIASAIARTERLQANLERQAGLLKSCESVFPTLDYLSHRVEFVRREVLFETKYGKTPGYAEQADAEPRIIDQAAVERARNEGLRLNVGCGHVPVEGYVNIDRRVLPNVQVKAEAHDLPFERGEVAEIYSAHLLEHFPQEQLRRQVLPHWRALLALGRGKLVAVMPDAEVMLNEYHRGTYPYENLREVLFGGQDYDGDFHFNMFIPDQLSMLLREAGFNEISWPVRGRVNGKCFEMMVEAW